MTAGLFRAHIRRRPEDDSGRGAACRDARAGVDCRHPRDAEIQDLHDARRRELDVRWLQIAMHDAALVRRFERARDLSREPERLGQRHTTDERDMLRQRRAFDELEDERLHAVCSLEPVNRGDVRMVE